MEIWSRTTIKRTCKIEFQSYNFRIVKISAKHLKRRIFLFIDSILQDQSISPSFYDGLMTQKVVDAAKESNERGRWVSP